MAIFAWTWVRASHRYCYWNFWKGMSSFSEKILPERFMSNNHRFPSQ